MMIEEGENTMLERTETEPILAIFFLIHYLKQRFHHVDLSPGDTALVDSNQVQRRPGSAVALVHEQSPRAAGSIGSSSPSSCILRRCCFVVADSASVDGLGGAVAPRSSRPESRRVIDLVRRPQDGPYNGNQFPPVRVAFDMARRDGVQHGVSPLVAQGRRGSDLVLVRSDSFDHGGP
jgi:hypothetical protein